MESYFDLCMCAMLGLLAFAEQEEHRPLFENTVDIACSVVTILYCICIVVFPYLAYRAIRKNKGKLYKEKV